MFDSGSPSKIINMRLFGAEGGELKLQIWHCNCVLVYNDTFVNIDDSKISCLKIKGNGTNFSTGGRLAEAETGFVFRLGFSHNVKGSRISSASVGKLYL